MDSTSSKLIDREEGQHQTLRESNAFILYLVLEGGWCGAELENNKIGDEKRYPFKQIVRAKGFTTALNFEGRK